MEITSVGSPQTMIKSRRWRFKMTSSATNTVVGSDLSVHSVSMSIRRGKSPSCSKSTLDHNTHTHTHSLSHTHTHTHSHTH